MKRLNTPELLVILGILSRITYHSWYIRNEDRLNTTWHILATKHPLFLVYNYRIILQIWHSKNRRHRWKDGTPGVSGRDKIYKNMNFSMIVIRYKHKSFLRKIIFLRSIGVWVFQGRHKGNLPPSVFLNKQLTGWFAVRGTVDTTL